MHDEDAIIVELQLTDRTVLSQDFLVYPYAERFLIPLGAFAKYVGLGIDVDLEQGIATGFVLREDRLFRLDAAGRTAQIAGRSIDLHGFLIVVGDADMFVDLGAIRVLFPMEVTLDQRASILVVDPREKLPIQLREEREKESAAQAAGRRSQENPTTVHEPLSGWLDGFALDQSLGLQATTQPNLPARRVEHRTTVAGELLGFDALGRVTGQDSRIERRRLTLIKKDPQEHLLGWLGASSITLLDYQDPVLPLVGGASDIRGIAVDNFPVNEPLAFDTYSFEGDLVPDWDVSLLRDQVVIGRQVSGRNGRYEFKDVPLIYGVNRFRLVFHGPQGQEREEVKTLWVNQSSVPKSKAYYRLSLARDLAQRPANHAEATYGLSKTLTLAAGANEFSFTDPGVPDVVSTTYLTAGTRSFFDALMIFSDIAQQTVAPSPSGNGRASSGRAGQVGVKVPVEQASFGVKTITARTYHSPVLPKQSGRFIAQRQEADVTATLWRNPSLQSSATLVEDHLDDASVTRAVRASLSASEGLMYLSQEGEWRREIGHRSWAAHTAVSVFPGMTHSETSADWTASGVVSVAERYDFAPHHPYQVTTGWDWQRSSNLHTAQVGVLRLFDEVTLGLRASFDSHYQKAAMIDLSWSMLSRHGASLAKVDKLPMTDKGAVAFVFFKDKNGDGKRSDDEPMLKGVGVIVNSVKQEGRTSADGELLITHQPPYVDLGVEIDLETLEDPLLFPAEARLVVRTRPGKITRVEVPLIETSEVDGDVLQQKAGKLVGMAAIQVELRGKDGTLVRRVLSSFDGFFSLDRIPPGRYSLSVDKQQLLRLGFTSDPDTYEMDLTAGGSVLGQRKFVLVKVQRR